MRKLPNHIANYITVYYPDAYLSDYQVKKTKEYGQLYKINLHENDLVHHLLFNDKGALINSLSKPKYPVQYRGNVLYGQENV